MLVSFRTLSSPDALWPPREQRRGANAFRLTLEDSAARGLGVFEVVDAGEVAVRERGVGQRPEMFGGLDLGRVGGQEEQMHVVGHAQFHAAMPAGAVEDQYNLFARPGAHLACKGGQLDLKERDGDGGRQVEEDATRGRMDKPDDIAPLIAGLHWRHGSLPYRRPDAAQDGLEANATLVSRPGSSTLARGNAAASLLRSGRSFFEGGLRRWVGLGVGRSRNLGLYRRRCK